MSIEFDQLRELLQQQQKQFEEAQLKLIESLTQKLYIQTAAASTGESSVSSTDAAAASITEFTFDALSGHTFDSWFKRYIGDLLYGPTFLSHTRGQHDQISERISEMNSFRGTRTFETALIFKGMAYAVIRNLRGEIEIDGRRFKNVRTR
ncbi:hypothetical protein T265_01551 [Opisthorchis viverrini]|uniref:Uncharacterized protein n=1 Tax=Opisthorchis viverrini TaxID=6198 RepID=A0A075A248_OPIVI|nr:hypothetical protein T265_01551 [Opisthorchis viverrini]KER32322.1 hypothetical protein T265_01551 [Opisthorchis viverrini]